MEKIKLNPNCVCPKPKCENHSNCEACIESHKEKDHPPACQRDDLNG